MTFSLKVFLLLSQFNELTPPNYCTLCFVFDTEFVFGHYLFLFGFTVDLNFSQIYSKVLLVIGLHSLFYPYPELA